MVFCHFWVTLKGFFSSFLNKYVKWIFAHHIAKRLPVTHSRMGLMAQCHCASLLDDMELMRLGKSSKINKSNHQPTFPMKPCPQVPHPHRLPKENLLGTIRNGPKANWNFSPSLIFFFSFVFRDRFFRLSYICIILETIGDK